jgi:hypothetical protein
MLPSRFRTISQAAAFKNGPVSAFDMAASGKNRLGKTASW